MNLYEIFEGIIYRYFVESFKKIGRDE